MTKLEIAKCFECGVMTEIFRHNFCRECFAKLERETLEPLRKVTLEDFIPLQRELDAMLGREPRDYCGQTVIRDLNKGKTNE